MRRYAIVISLFSIAACLFSGTAGASMARPIIYSKTSWNGRVRMANGTSSRGVDFSQLVTT